MGDLNVESLIASFMEKIKDQAKEIERLKAENTLLKAELLKHVDDMK